MRALKAFVLSEWGEDPQTVVVGTSELGQAVGGVEGVGLSTSGPEAWAGGFQPIWMDREHGESRLQQTPHQNTVSGR